jgi:hypothetical protein
MEGRPTMTTDRTPDRIDHGALLGEARFEAVRLLVDGRLHDAATGRLTASAGRRLRDRIGSALVVLGTAIAGERGVAVKRPTPAEAAGIGLSSATRRS